MTYNSSKVFFVWQCKTHFLFFLTILLFLFTYSGYPSNLLLFFSIIEHLWKLFIFVYIINISLTIITDKFGLSFLMFCTFFSYFRWHNIISFLFQVFRGVSLHVNTNNRFVVVKLDNDMFVLWKMLIFRLMLFADCES